MNYKIPFFEKAMIEAQEGRFPTLEKLIKYLSGPEIDEVVYHMCMSGQYDLLMKIRRCITINWNIALNGALKSANEELIIYTIENGAICDNIVFHNCAKYGLFEAVQYLAQFSPEYINDGLVGAAAGGHIEIVNFLLSKGAKPNNKSLVAACQGGNIEIVEIMVKGGAKNWNDGLIVAAEMGNTIILRMMLEKGATALDLALITAAIYGKLIIVKILLEKGAKAISYALAGAQTNKHEDVSWILKINCPNSPK